MPAGRPPLPANVHALNGNPSKKPESELAPGAEPTVELPPPPDVLNEQARKVWYELGEDLRTLGLISKVYSPVFALLCAAKADWMRMRAALEKAYAAGAEDELRGYVARYDSGATQITGLHVALNKAEEKLLRYAQEFGLTPASRTKVTMGGSAQMALFPDQTDPMAAFTRAAANATGRT
jgi:P27 family predicted phage terminase small subunit